MTSECISLPGTTNERGEYLRLVFSPSSAPLCSRWRNNGLSADFLGDYVTTFLPASVDALDEKRQDQIRHTVTYVANELLENAMKYHARGVQVPITIYLELADDHISVEASNGVGLEQAEHYRNFLERIAREDPADLLVRQLEKNGADEGSDISCLGLLTMVNDYGARLSWRFDPNSQPETLTVTTSALVSLKEA